MSQESAANIRTQRKGTLAEQVRSIADHLKQETDLQIKATSRILGAAAKIAENHEHLISEVVNMVEEDLDQQTCVNQTKSYTVNVLKQQFKTLSKAKSHFGLKVSSWVALVKKLNEPSAQNPMPDARYETSVLDRLNKIEGEITIMRTEISQMLFLLKQLTVGKK